MRKKRKYRVYFTDNPYSAMTCLAFSESGARRIGNLYIRQWQLDAKIDRIEVDRIEEAEEE